MQMLYNVTHIHSIKKVFWQTYRESVTTEDLETFLLRLSTRFFYKIETVQIPFWMFASDLYEVIPATAPEIKVSKNRLVMSFL